MIQTIVDAPKIARQYLIIIFLFDITDELYDIA
jgi:hypothetical protein